MFNKYEFYYFIIRCSKLRSKFCFLTPPITDLEKILDAAKVFIDFIFLNKNIKQKLNFVY